MIAHLPFSGLETQEDIWESGSQFERKPKDRAGHWPLLKHRDGIKVKARHNYAEFHEHGKKMKMLSWPPHGSTRLRVIGLF